MIAAVEVPRKIWTREEAHQLAALFPDAGNWELINGELIDHRIGKNAAHTFWITVIRNWLITVFGGAFIRTEAPIYVSPDASAVNEPEPDISVTLRSIYDDAGAPKPEEVRLLVEISDSTLQFDLNVKGPLYASAGIAEYWVLDVNKTQLIVHRLPKDGVYTLVQIYAADQAVAPLAALDAQFCLDKLLTL